MISKEAKRIKDYMFSVKLPDTSKLSIDGARRGLVKMTAVLDAPKGCVTETVDAGGVKADWTKASSTEKKQVLIYFHGGGYTLGSPYTHRGLVGTLSQLTGVPVLSVDYRLAPEYPHPAAVEDATKAYIWLLEQGFPSRSIAMGGDSAGGGLTIATMLNLKSKGVPLPAAAVLISPWVDLTCSGETIETKLESDPMITRGGLQQMCKLYAGEVPTQSPLVSPLFGDLTGLPPVLIHVGTDEMLLSDSTRLSEKLEQAGVACSIRIWEEMFHVFPTTTMLPESIKANNEIADFILSYIS